MNFNDYINKIINGDVLESLKKMPDKCVHLIFTSPPYDVNIDYGHAYKDDKIWIDYLKWLNDIWIECSRVLVSGGRLVINIDAITNKNRDNPEGIREYVRPIHAELIYQMRQIKGMMYRGEICWYKQNAPGNSPSWGSWDSCSNPLIRRNHEGLYVWSKDQWKLEGNNELSDMTKEEFIEYTFSFWHIAPETSKKSGHNAPFPEELAKRVIKLYSYRNDVVMDIFSGTGTTSYMAAMLKRKYIGIEINKNYCEFAENRIKSLDTLIGGDYVPRSKRLEKKKEINNNEEDSLV